MKKYLVGMSVLVLAACGGGGSGGLVASGTDGNYTINVVRAGTVDGAVSNDVAESNSNVTGMVSQILKASNGATINVGRSATNIQHNGVTYTESYDLSDVDFNFTDEGFGGMVRFHVDGDKKITHFDILDDETLLTVIDDNLYVESDNGELSINSNNELVGANGTLTYDSTTGIYTYDSSNNNLDGTYIVHNGKILEADPYDGPYRQVGNKLYALNRFNRTGDDGFTFAGNFTTTNNEQVSGTLTYNSSGKDMDLKYSDFGYFQLASANDVNRPVNVIGGYEIKQIETLPTAEKTFTGRAVASVISVLGGENTGTVFDPNDNGGTIYGNATLKFKNGSEKLTAEFNDWYNVSYNNGTVKFDGAGKNIPAAYQLLSTDVDARGNIIPDGEISHDFRYYGDNGTPAEAVGLIQVRDCDGAGCNSDYNSHHEVRMNMSFGVK